MARVLVIDDDLMLSRVLHEHLTNEGYEVMSASMVEEGIQKAIDLQPDLIMLDVQLPDATGFQACGQLKQDPRTKAIPIIMMTGSARNLNQQNIGKHVMGASDYILKPFNVIEVGDKVHHLLGTKSKAAETKTLYVKEAEPIVEAPKAVEEAVIMAPTPVGEPVIDLGLEPEPVPMKVKYDYPIAPLRKEQMDFPLIRPSKPVMQVVISTPAPMDAAPAPIPVPEPTPEPVREEPIPEPVEKPTWSNIDLAEPSRADLTIKLPSMKRLPWISFPAHLALAMLIANFTPKGNVAATATYVAGGWMLLIGLLTVTASLVKVALKTSETFDVLSVAALPIVLRSVLRLVGTLAPGINILHGLTVARTLPTATFWFRPLDLFEMTAMILLGFALHRRTESRLGRCIAATVLVALGWALTSRGYFHPF